MLQQHKTVWNLFSGFSFRFFFFFLKLLYSYHIQSVGNRVGVTEPFLMRMAHGAPTRTSKSKEKVAGLHGKCQNRMGVANKTPLTDDQALRVCKRFHVALILSRLVQVFVSFVYIPFYSKKKMSDWIAYVVNHLCILMVLSKLEDRCYYLHYLYPID